LGSLSERKHSATVSETVWSSCVSRPSRNQSQSASPRWRDDLVQQPRNFGIARKRRRQQN